MIANLFLAIAVSSGFMISSINNSSPQNLNDTNYHDLLYYKNSFTLDNELFTSYRLESNYSNFINAYLGNLEYYTLNDDYSYDITINYSTNQNVIITNAYDVEIISSMYVFYTYNTSQATYQFPTFLVDQINYIDFIPNTNNFLYDEILLDFGLSAYVNYNMYYFDNRYLLPYVKVPNYLNDDFSRKINNFVIHFDFDNSLTTYYDFGYINYSRFDKVLELKAYDSLENYVVHDFEYLLKDNFNNQIYELLSPYTFKNYKDDYIYNIPYMSVSGNFLLTTLTDEFIHFFTSSVDSYYSFVPNTVSSRLSTYIEDNLNGFTFSKNADLYTQALQYFNDAFDYQFNFDFTYNFNHYNRVNIKTFIEFNDDYYSNPTQCSLFIEIYFNSPSNTLKMYSCRVDYSIFNLDDSYRFGYRNFVEMYINDQTYTDSYFNSQFQFEDDLYSVDKYTFITDFLVYSDYQTFISGGNDDLNNSEYMYLFDLLFMAMSSFSFLFSIQILPYLSLGTLILIPLAIGILIAIMKIFKL